jgi:hypothetical protein
MEPLRARGLSILATALGLLLVYRVAAGRCAPFAGAVAVFLLAGATAATAVGLLYLPILSQMLVQLRGYGAEWGRDDGTWRAVGETIQRYVVPPSPSGTMLPVGIALVLALLVVLSSVGPWAATDADERALVRLCALSSATFFVACRVLESPLIRTTSFVGPPLLVAGAVLAARGTERLPLSVRVRGAPLVVVGLIVLLARPMAPARFLPIEDWSGVSRFLERTFPPELPVHVSWSGDFLEAHGASGRKTTVPFDGASFARGEQILFDDALGHGARVGSTRPLAPSASVRFPQQRSDDGFTEVRFAPPPERLVEALETETGRRAGPEPFDGDFRSGWSTEVESGASGGWVTFTLVPGTKYRSLVVVLKGAGPAVRGWVTFDGGWSNLPAEAIEVQGELLLAHLGDRRVRVVHLDLGAPREGEMIVEAWAYRSGRGAGRGGL